MRKGLTILFITALGFLPLIAKEVLIQAYRERNPGFDPFNQDHFQVVAELDNCYLVKLSDSELHRLGFDFDSVRVLEIPQGTELFYVKTPPWFERQQLSGYGLILGETENGVLVSTRESEILGITRLPVELCHLPLEPLTRYPEPPLPQSAPVSDSLLWELIGRVNSDSVLSHIRRLVKFYTRYSTTESCRAAGEWMRQKLNFYGCDSTALEPYRPNYAPNVIGIKRGRVNPVPVYVICAHIDNTSDYAPEICPGSDDNASGAAAVIEAARVFKDIEFAHTVYFIGFTGEEQGLFGSDSFCRRAARRGDSIKAALNFDMISYGRQGLDSFEVIGKISNPSCSWLVDTFIFNARTYTALKPIRRLVNSAPYSDHHSFWQRGYVALCGIEHDFTPMYHTIGDTIGPLYYRECGTNNWLMATEAIKAAIATIAKLAGARHTQGAKENSLTTTFALSRTVGRPPFVFPFLSQAQKSPWTVYDILGRKIATGTDPVWSGRDGQGIPAPPGIYMVRLTGLTAEPGFRLIVTP